jgi:hypothetical protein
MGKYALCAAVFAGLTAMASGSAAYADGAKIDWSDTYVSYRYVPMNKQPGFGKNAPEHAVNISYANGWTYGSNFVSLDMEYFQRYDQSNCAFCSHTTAGSAELYAVFETTFSGNKIFKTNAFGFGPIADTGLEVDVEGDTQNDQFASFKKLLVTGPQFAIAIPKGFWTVTLGVSKEWNTDGFLPNGNGTNYNPAPILQTAWDLPFKIGPVAMDFTGFTNIIGPKGKGATGDYKQREEILAHPKLLADVGALVGYEPGKIQAGIGYEYWLNKFGSYNSGLKSTGGLGGGTQENSVFFEIGYHFH